MGRKGGVKAWVEVAKEVARDIRRIEESGWSGEGEWMVGGREGGWVTVVFSEGDGVAWYV